MIKVTLADDLWVMLEEGEYILTPPIVTTTIDNQRTGAPGVLDPPPYRIFHKGTTLGISSYLHSLTGDGTWVTCKQCGGGWPTPTTASRSVCG